MRRFKAQSTTEYVVFIGIVAAALVSMQAYFKRSVQGGLRKQAEAISGGEFYSPGATSSLSKITKTTQEKSYLEQDPTTKKMVNKRNIGIISSSERKEDIASLEEEPER